MPRARSPSRDKAFELYKAANGEKPLVEIAAELNVSDSQIRKWKNQDKWDDQIKGNATKQKPESKSNVTKRIGAPKGNKNAIGNRGNPNPPNQMTKRNTMAVKHGLFRKYLPQDEEYLAVFDAAGQVDSLDMLWTQIQIKFANIIHAQKIMFVDSKDEMIKELKKEKEFSSETGGGTETEWEFQFAWDRMATALNSQARAMGQLTSMIRQYEEMCRQGWADEEQLARLDKLKGEVNLLKQKAEQDQDKPIEVVITRKGERS